MFMLAFCLLCLVNPLLASPVRPFKEPSLQSLSLSGLGDYPDLTNGLTDAEVQATLQDLTLEDLKCLDNLLSNHISQREDESKASLRTERRQAIGKSSRGLDRALDRALDEGCRDDDDDQPKQVLCTKRPTFPTTRHCIKKTTVEPRTTRTARPVTSCKPKSTYGPIDDDFDGSKCTKAKPKNKCKPKEEIECESDDFMCLAKRRLDKERNMFQEQEAVAAETPGKELAGLRKEKREESISSLTAQGEQQEFIKGFRLKANLEQPEVHRNQARWAREPLAKQHQDHHVSFEGEHQSHLEQAKAKLQHEENLRLKHEAKLKLEHEKNLKLEHEANLKREHQANLKLEPQANLQPEKLANLHQDQWENVEQDRWANIAQNHWANVKKDYWADADRDHPQAYFDQKHYNDFKLRKQAHFQPTQEQLARFEVDNPYNYASDYQGSFKRNPSAKIALRNRNTFESAYRDNQDRFEQSHQASHLPDYRQADLNWDQLRHEPDLSWDQARLQRNWGQDMEMEHPVKLKQENQANREQRSEVTYHQSNQQWRPHQAEEFKKMDREPVAVKSAPLEPYQPAQRKRNAEVEKPFEKQSAPIEEKKPIMAKHEEPQPLKADLPKQETHLDGDSFIANSARDPPLYLIPMQNDIIQSRLNEDRSLSEGLNLDKLTGEKEPSPADWESDNKREKRLNLDKLTGEKDPSPADWESDNKRGKRENRDSDDAPENSKETYIKKLMDSFPRDHGEQINANMAALTDWRFAHMRIKRSFV